MELEILSDVGPSTLSPMVIVEQSLLIPGKSTTPSEFLGYLSDLSSKSESSDEEDCNGDIVDSDDETYQNLPPQKRTRTTLAIPVRVA